MVTKRSQTKRLTVFSRRKNTCVSNNLFLRYCSTFLWLMTTTNGAIKNVILLLHVHKTFPLLYYSRQRTAWKSKAKKMAKRRVNERKRWFFNLYTTRLKKQTHWPCLIRQSRSFEVSTAQHKNIPNASTNCNMVVKSVIRNLQSVLWYSTAISYCQVVIHNLKAQYNLTSWSFWRIKCLFSVYTVSFDWNRTTPCHLKGNGCSILRLTGLCSSKTRPSEHLVMAINQPLKRTDHDCWWVANLSGDTGASGPWK